MQLEIFDELASGPEVSSLPEGRRLGGSPRRAPGSWERSLAAGASAALLGLVVTLAAGTGANARPAVSSGPGDESAAVVRTPRLRTTDLRLVKAIRRGYAGSPSFRALVAAIETSDLIVYIERRYGFGAREAGRLHLAGEAGGQRFVRIFLNAALTDHELVAYIAHELQHAREIADAPHVVDQDALREFYCRIGHVGLYGFDTDAAETVTEQVSRELAAARR